MPFPAFPLQPDWIVLTVIGLLGFIVVIAILGIRDIQRAREENRKRRELDRQEDLRLLLKTPVSSNKRKRYQSVFYSMLVTELEVSPNGQASSDDDRKVSILFESNREDDPLLDGANLVAYIAGSDVITTSTLTKNVDSGRFWIAHLSVPRGSVLTLILEKEGS